MPDLRSTMILSAPIIRLRTCTGGARSVVARARAPVCPSLATPLSRFQVLVMFHQNMFLTLYFAVVNITVLLWKSTRTVEGKSVFFSHSWSHNVPFCLYILDPSLHCRGFWLLGPCPFGNKHPYIVYTYAHTHTCTHACTHTHIHTHTHTHTHTRTHTRAHTHTHTCTHTHTHTQGIVLIRNHALNTLTFTTKMNHYTIPVTMMMMPQLPSTPPRLSPTKQANTHCSFIHVYMQYLNYNLTTTFESNCVSKKISMFSCM